jgi:endonuclease YncB( thermonuclease family)
MLKIMLKRKTLWLSLFLVFFVYDAASAQTITSVKVKKIIDGDTILVVNGQGNIKVRLWGIDTPEYRQPYSKAAARFTRKLLQNTTVDLIVKDWDDYGRMVALVKMADGQSVNELLIKSGYAWVHIYYCKEPVCQTWKNYEKDARASNLGLWQEAEAIAPWVWKRQNKYRKKK